MSRENDRPFVLNEYINNLARKNFIIITAVISAVALVTALRLSTDSSIKLNTSQKTPTVLADFEDNFLFAIESSTRHTTSSVRTSRHGDQQPVEPPQPLNPDVEVKINGEKINVPESGRMRSTVRDGQANTNVDINTRNDNISIDTHSHNGQNIDINIEVHSQSTGESGENTEEGGRRDRRIR